MLGTELEILKCIRRLMNEYVSCAEQCKLVNNHTGTYAHTDLIMKQV
jgi:hypothetical protein